MMQPDPTILTIQSDPNAAVMMEPEIAHTSVESLVANSSPQIERHIRPSVSRRDPLTMKKKDVPTAPAANPLSKLSARLRMLRRKFSRTTDLDAQAAGNELLDMYHDAKLENQRLVNTIKKLQDEKRILNRSAIFEQSEKNRHKKELDSAMKELDSALKERNSALEKRTLVVKMFKASKLLERFFRPQFAEHDDDGEDENDEPSYEPSYEESYEPSYEAMHETTYESSYEPSYDPSGSVANSNNLGNKRRRLDDQRY